SGRSSTRDEMRLVNSPATADVNKPKNTNARSANVFIGLLSSLLVIITARNPLSRRQSNRMTIPDLWLAVLALTCLTLRHSSDAHVVEAPAFIARAFSFKEAAAEVERHVATRVSEGVLQPVNAIIEKS